jgi:hypothetical protein
MATGLVAGRLDDLPACEELVQRIVREAYGRLSHLGACVPQGSYVHRYSNPSQNR